MRGKVGWTSFAKYLSTFWFLWCRKHKFEENDCKKILCGGVPEMCPLHTSVYHFFESDRILGCISWYLSATGMILNDKISRDHDFQYPPCCLGSVLGTPLSEYQGHILVPKNRRNVYICRQAKCYHSGCINPIKKRQNIQNLREGVKIKRFF